MKIVCLGGGTGLSTLLEGLKKLPGLDLVGIPTMFDSGGHSGELRDRYGILPPGDIRAVITALAGNTEVGETCRVIFTHREGTNSLGNILLQVLESRFGFAEAARRICQLVGAVGKAVPVSLDSCDLVAELEDGTVITGEANIYPRQQEQHIPIKRMRLEPPAVANPEALEELAGANLIVLGPGDLFTSIIPNLLVKGVPEAIVGSPAPVLYICNLMSRPSETHGFSAWDFVERLEQYLGAKVDAVMYNTRRPSDRLAEAYREKERAHPILFDPARADTDHLWIGGELLSEDGDLIRHDPDKLANAVLAYALARHLNIFSRH
jgi:uncharacterized cofD-like protein